MENMADLVRFFALLNEYDVWDDILYRADEQAGSVVPHATCSDFFWWGTADAEPITAANLDVLRQAFADVHAIDTTLTDWGLQLFCARVRQLRPQGAYYRSIPASLHALFDAAGPKRDVDIANPYEHPGDGGAYAYRRDACAAPPTSS